MDTNVESNKGLSIVNSESNQVNKSPLPTSTQNKPIPTQESTKSTSKEISYYLPSDWISIKDTTAKFEIGYNPAAYNPMPLSLRIDLNSKSCCSNIVSKLLPYNG